MVGEILDTSAKCITRRSCNMELIGTVKGEKDLGDYLSPNLNFTSTWTINWFNIKCNLCTLFLKLYKALVWPLGIWFLCMEWDSQKLESVQKRATWLVPEARFLSSILIGSSIVGSGKELHGGQGRFCPWNAQKSPGKLKKSPRKFP